MADGDRDGAIAADLAGNVDRAIAGINERAVRDADRIPVGAVAGAALGNDHDAPKAVVTRSGGSRRRGAEKARKSQGQAARGKGFGAILVRHEPRPVFAPAFRRTILLSATPFGDDRSQLSLGRLMAEIGSKTVDMGGWLMVTCRWWHYLRARRIEDGRASQWE